MARINNYIKDDIVEPTDIVIGTEKSTGKTKNYSIDSIRNFFVTETNVGGVIFKKGNHLVSGEFTANSNYFSGVTEFKFNKTNTQGDSVIPIFNTLKTNLVNNRFTINVEDSTNQNRFILAKILNIIDNDTFFTITLDIVKNVGNGELVTGNNFSIEVGLYTEAIDGTKITTVTSNKVGNVTTVTVNGDFDNAPLIFEILDGDATSGVDWSNLLNIPISFPPSAHTHTISDVTSLQSSLDSKVDKNANIVAGTKTKITYDVKGLVTNGEDATTADIADSLNKRYVTDADLVDIGNLSGVNTGDQNLSGYELLSNKQNSLATDGTGTKYPTVDAITAPNIPAARLGNSTFTSVQHIQDLFHSAGWTSGGVITNAGGGLITVSAGTGLIRAINSDVATIYFTDFPASTPANVVLVDGSQNYIYVEYNGGTPRVIATTIQRADYNTSFLIGAVYRIGTTLHINSTVKTAISDHAGKMIAFNKEVMPYARANGSMISEVATRGFAITAGTFWNGLVRFTTNAFSTATGSFFYFYRNGVGGWTKVPTQTQINNTQFDNGSGALATLSNNKYGIHWVFIDTDGDTYVVYGQGDYTLIEAQNKMVPASLPVEITSHGFVVGKIIIQKSLTTFAQIESAFAMGFSSAMASEHNSLVGLQGGAAGDYQHLTATQATIATQEATNTLSGYVSAGTQTFGGVKTFTLSPIVPTPTTNTQVTNKSYVDAKVADTITDGVTTIAPSQNAVFDALVLKEPANANIQAHISSTANPHAVTKTQVGLSNVDNTSDASKPVSTATQTALDGKLNNTDSAVTSKLLTGLNITGGTIVAGDTILQGFGKLQNLINGLLGGSIFQTVWNAATNSPNLTSSVGTKGHYYIVNVDGATNLNGITDWKVGDWAIFDGSVWRKVDNTDAVISVNGYTGAVNLVTGDIFEGAGSIGGRPNQLFFTEARARAVISDTITGINYNASTGILALDSGYFIPTTTEQTTWNNKQNALTNPITGTGTTNYLPKFTGVGAIGNSQIFDNGTNVGIGIINPLHYLDITKTAENQRNIHGINSSVSASILQQDTTSVGTDQPLTNQYYAWRFTASASHTAGSLAVRLRTVGTVTNTTDSVRLRIYSDNAGVPNTLLLTSDVVRMGSLTSSYVSYFFSCDLTLVSGTVYWIAVERTAVVTGGGSITLDRGITDLTTTNVATPASGDWIINAGLGSYILYGRTPRGGNFFSRNDNGVRGESTNSIGVQGQSTNNFGVQGISTNSVAVYGLSTNGVAVYGLSTNNHGLLGISTNSIGVQGQSTNNVGLRGESINNTGGHVLITGVQTAHNTSNTLLVRRNTSGAFNATGNVLQITDAPTVGGTISGALISGMIDATTRLNYDPRVVDGSTAIAYMMDTRNSLVNTTAKLFELRNNGSARFNVFANGNVTTSGSVKVSDDVAVASISNVGAIRYRVSGNNSYAEMCMQVSASSYEWTTLVIHTW